MSIRVLIPLNLVIINAISIGGNLEKQNWWWLTAAAVLCVASIWLLKRAIEAEAPDVP